MKERFQITRHWRMNGVRYRLQGVKYEDGSLSVDPTKNKYIYIETKKTEEKPKEEEKPKTPELAEVEVK